MRVKALNSYLANSFALEYFWLQNTQGSLFRLTTCLRQTNERTFIATIDLDKDAKECAGTGEINMALKVYLFAFQAASKHTQISRRVKMSLSHINSIIKLFFNQLSELV